MKNTRTICALVVLLMLAGAATAVARDIAPGLHPAAFTADDPHNRDGKAYHEYRLTATAHDVFFVGVLSDELDTYVVVTSPAGVVLENDDFAGTDAGLFFVAERSGPAVIRATTFGTGEYGEYRLDVRRLASTTLTRDRPVRTDLTGDPARPVFAAYTYNAVGEGLAKVTLESDDFDAYLYVISAENDVAVNDDAHGDTLNSELSVPVSAHDRLTVVATSFNRTSTGLFTIAATEEPYPAVADGDRLEPGTSVEGFLNRDAAWHHGRPSVRFTLYAEEGENVTVDVQSRQFDAYVTVQAPYGDVYSDDDSGEGTDARLTFVAPSSGLYDVYAAAYSESETGTFTITYSVSEHAADSIVVTGELGPRSPRDDGSPYGEHPFRFESGEIVRIHARSRDFDTVLELRNSSGRVVAENDDWDGTDSMVEHYIVEGGMYTVRVYPYGRDETGRYEITVGFIEAKG